MSRAARTIALPVATFLVVALAAAGSAQAQGTVAYVAATWSDTAVHLLDSGLNDLGSFPAGASSPNGITTDGTYIYTGHFSSQEVIAYDFSGNEQFRWSATLSGLQGMTMVGGELAVARSGNIDFFDPATGTYLRTIPAPESGTIEGLTYDGTSIWALGSSGVYAVDPADGTVLATLPNAAASCSYGGSGIANGGAGELILACTDGTWYRVSTADGSVIASGNNGLDMYGLEAAVAGGPQPRYHAIPVTGPLGTTLLALLLAAAGIAILVRFRST